MIKHILITCAFLFSVFSTSLKSQNTEQYRPGEFLIQLHKSDNIQFLKSQLKKKGLINIETVSKRFNIYLLTFNTKALNQQSMLNELKSKKQVVNAQFNHFLSLRGADDLDSIPDDPNFSGQWSLQNTGQNGGTVDADIDATDAWTITHGGLTVLGDTIVVAVVDGGTDLNHQDLDFKHNWDEIPGNGIDDDNNGYVDDVVGWNAYNNNGSVPVHSHGAHVCGIIGAKGNNGIGVAGVNWNMKVLPIAGSSTNEATVVKALSYIYTARERYDSSNGQAGAFVVSQNNSFGIDQGNPDNYPIWEAMYDSLGKIGVMSVAATANASWDIDVVGDVPTGFTTDYMVAVTNTTRADRLYTAGYGDTAIDLGAPGTAILSTIPNNSYGTKTGTSMATPHVTGSIALILAAADSTFIADYKINPAEKILMIKNYLLQGVDTLPTLLGKTVSGGRLNVYNSIELLLNRPILTATPALLHEEIAPNSTIESNLTLSNTGNDTLSYKLTVPEDAPWLSLSSDTGMLIPGNSDLIMVTYNDNGMDTGLYITNIHAVTDGAGSKDIPVYMHVTNFVSTQEMENDAVAVLVSPNPFYGQTKISFGHHQTEAVTFTVFDAQGKQVYQETKTIQQGTGSFNVNGNRLPSGIYFYHLNGNRWSVSGKLIKK